MSDYESFGTGRYGADDDPHGPPSPPLELSPDAADRASAEEVIGRWPYRRDEPAPLPEPAGPDVAVCRTCGGVVAVDRIRD